MLIARPQAPRRVRIVSVCFVTLLLLAGCFGNGKSGEDPDEDGEVPLHLRPVTSAPFTSYLHNVSQPIASLSVGNAIIEQYRTPVTELIELDTWIARPDVPYPV